MLSQNPIFRVEEHLSHNLTDALWLSMPVTTSVVRRASTEPVRTTWQTRSGSALAWDCAFGAVQTSFSTMSSWSPSLLASQMLQMVRFTIRQLW
jgi:hypothetical protein